MRSKKIAPEKPPQLEEEIFENFKINLAELRPEVRQKAIALAQELMSKGLEKDQAINKGIQEAETWFLESQG